MLDFGIEVVVEAEEPVGEPLRALGDLTRSLLEWQPLVEVGEEYESRKIVGGELLGDGGEAIDE